MSVLRSEQKSGDCTGHHSCSEIVVEQGEEIFMDKSRDQDRGKGATEQNPQNEGEGGNTSMQGQLGHRDEDTELKNADSDLSG